MWTVGEIADGHRGLVERVDSSLQQQATAAFATGTNASQYLQNAWIEIHSRAPDYELALDHANKALEAAAQPVVIPANTRATLGKIVRALEDKPSKWTCALGSVEQLADRLDVIWKAQNRHGVTTTPVPAVDPATARAAVYDAITLVQWFEGEAVTPVP